MTHQFPSRNLPPFANVLQTTVKPLEKTSHLETIDPTIVDSFTPEFFFPCLFAFRLAERSDAVYSQTVKRIKDSLSKVLIPFFSFAGRWVSGPGIGRRKLLCNDEGVPFIEAYMDVELKSVVQASSAFQPVPELHGHSFLGMDATQFTQPLPQDGGVPAIFVQVTRFNCGGLVLAVTFNHIHVDGEGFSRFMKAWSDISRTNATAVKVDHNRAQLDVPSLAALFPDPSSFVNFKPAEKLGPWALKVFEVDASTIKALKQEAKDMIDGGGYVSTGDCIVAQLMKSIEVLRPSLLDDEGLIVSRVVEGRARFFDHPVPDVCGNATTILLPPEIPTGELSGLPLASIARRVREKLESVKREDWLGLEVIGKSLGALANKKLKNLLVTSWFNFGLYNIDFGFGKPYFLVGPNTYASTGTFASALIFPPIPGRSSSVATVNVWSTPDVLQALEKDPQFHQFFLVQ